MELIKNEELMYIAGGGNTVPLPIDNEPMLLSTDPGWPPRTPK
jgi:hypothetical protein